MLYRSFLLLFYTNRFVLAKRMTTCVKQKQTISDATFFHVRRKAPIGDVEVQSTCPEVAVPLFVEPDNTHPGTFLTIDGTRESFEMEEPSGPPMPAPVPVKNYVKNSTKRFRRKVWTKKHSYRPYFFVSLLDQTPEDLAHNFMYKYLPTGSGPSNMTRRP